MSALPEIDNASFESDAAGHIRRQLQVHGESPWSICEARLSESDYQRLRDWAASVTVDRLTQGFSSSLVLLAFVAEWNRRHSTGDGVWVGLPQLFRDSGARQYLFVAAGGPSQNLYRKIREACQLYHLRCIKDDEENVLRYYLTVQLQYGFSRPHALDQLGNWLRGQLPEVARRLLEENGDNRSKSFRRLVRDMKSYRSNYLPESEFRRTLRENSWVLPGWEHEIITLVNGIPSEGIEEEVEFRLLTEPRITWDDGPTARCRVCELPSRLLAPRYVLRHADQELVRYYRNASDVLEPDRREALLSLDKPDAIVTLETPEGAVVEVQSILLWRPENIAQVRPIGRAAEEPVEHLLNGEQALITSTAATVTPTPATWRTFGSKEHRRRWWLVDGAQRVTVNDNGIIWNGEPPPPPPAWTSTIRASLVTTGKFFQLGDRVQFNLDVAKDVEIVHAACVGLPLSFSDATRSRTSAVAIRAEMSGQCRLRIGVRRGRETAIVPRDVKLPVRAVVWADDGVELSRNQAISCFEIQNRPVMLLSDGPAVLIEGREILASLPSDKAARIRKVLGTGQELVVADRPFITEDHFRAAKSVIDRGIAKSLERHRSRIRLTLFRTLIPTDRHRLFVWSPAHGMAVLGLADVDVEQSGNEWAFQAPWDTDTLLAAIAYDGQCIAVASYGDDRKFFDPQSMDGADPLTRIALIRWCRLPGLKPEAANNRRPLMTRLAQFPLEMVKVALLDQGLPQELGLVYEDRQSPRGELFNVIFREAYVGYVPEDLTLQFDDLQNELDRVLTSHPILGCRCLLAVLPEMLKHHRTETRLFLLILRLRLLSLDDSAKVTEILSKERELLSRACKTFSENSRPMDEYALKGLIDSILDHVMKKEPLHDWDEKNLRTALGAASFREYLVAVILRRILDKHFS